MLPIKIDGVIGWDVEAKDFNEKLEQASGDLEIIINSPGGYVFDGISIFNAIKNYNKGKIAITVSGLSASMASIIMLAGDSLKLESNSVVMIHNPSNCCWGDYQAMQENADFLKKLANVMANTYQKNTDYSLEDIQGLMDKETYFLGEELSAWGDVLEETDNDQDEEAIETTAKMSVMAMCEKLKTKNTDLKTIQSFKMVLDTKMSVEAQSKPKIKQIVNKS